MLDDGRARRVAAAGTALLAYLAAWTLFALAARVSDLAHVDPRAPLGPLLGLLLIGAPLVAGASAGLAASVVSGAPTLRAALLGAAAGVPTFLAWAWSAFLGPFLLVAILIAVAAPPAAALLAAPRRGEGRARRRNGAAAAALVLAFAGVGAAIAHASQEGDRVATVVRFWPVEAAPYDPVDLTGVVEANPDVWALDSLAAAARGEATEASFLYEEDAEAYLALLEKGESERRSAEAGIDPPRYVVRYEGALVEYGIERFVVTPEGERRDGPPFL